MLALARKGLKKSQKIPFLGPECFKDSRYVYKLGDIKWLQKKCKD